MKLLCFLTLNLTLLTFSSRSQTTFNLSESKGRAEYLQAIYSTDQAIRFYEDSVMAASGWRSDEHNAAIDSLLGVDSALTFKIDDYLKSYGYPELEYYGEIANLTPWLILHHSPNEKIRMEHIKTLYRAYKDEELKERRMIEFLEREYRARFGRNYRSYTQGEIRIRELMDALEEKVVRG